MQKNRFVRLLRPAVGDDPEDGAGTSVTPRFPAEDASSGTGAAAGTVIGGPASVMEDCSTQQPPAVPLTEPAAEPVSDVVTETPPPPPPIEPAEPVIEQPAPAAEATGGSAEPPA
jgi:hypothetical protein